MSRPITAIDQVSPAWLTQVLQAGGYLNRGRVIAVQPGGQSSTTAGGPGFRPDHRFSASYSDEAPRSTPSHFYLKITDGSIYKLAGKQEMSFYTAIAGTMPDAPAVPCYHSAYDPDTGAAHFLLADLSATHRTLHPEEPATGADTEQMLEALARLHAYWWNHARLGRDIGILPTAKSLEQDFQKLGNLFPGYVDFLGDRLSDQRRVIYERVLSRFPVVLSQRLAGQNRLTIVHNDAHAGNFLLPRRPDQQTGYIVDWEQWGIHNGLRDVAYLIALFWYPERRARLEQALVGAYHRRLQAYGVTGYDWDTCWQDYRFHTIENLLVPFWAWIDQAEQWGFHRWHQLEKAMLAFETLECATFLA